MTSAIVKQPAYFPSVVVFNGKPVYPRHGNVAGFQRDPSAPIGVCEVTFLGVQTGSEIHIYLPDGTELTSIEACVADQVLSWSAYPAGSANNTVTITIIKRGLRWQKFPYQSSIGSSSIQIFPQPDLGYNNPA